MHHVLNWLGQGTAIALATYALLAALDRSRASARHVLCWAALLLVMVLPVLTLWPAEVFSPQSLSSAVPASRAIVTVPNAWWTSVPVMFAVCAVWFALFSSRIVGAWLQIRSARSACRAFPASLESRLLHWNRVRTTGRRARLALSNQTATAAVLGGIPPLIAVAPTSVARLTADELDRVVLHEWAHVQRRDDLLNLVQLAARALAGWHPAVWWLDRQLLIEREVACDETVVALTGSAKSYARSLTHLASLRLTGWDHAMSIGATSPTLTTRVRRILSLNRRLAPRWSATAVVAALVVLMAFSAVVGGLRLVGVALYHSPLERSLGGVTTPAVSSMAATRGTVLIRRAQESSPPSPGPLSPRGGRATQPVADRANVAVEPLETTDIGLRLVEPAVMAAAAQPILPVVIQDTIPQTPLPSFRTGPTVPVTIAGRLVTNNAAQPTAMTQLAPDARSVLPWVAARDAGAAIGRGSQRAGMATATFFSHFGRKISESF